jgi:hypothetical protein
MGYLVIGLFLWAIPSMLGCSWLAGLKGYSGISWGLTGLVLGPIAILTLGFAPRGFQPPYCACVECAEPVFIDATTCPHCQTDLVAERESDAELGEEHSDE